MILQSVQIFALDEKDSIINAVHGKFVGTKDTFRKSRMSLNAAVENSKRISTNLIDFEDITEKQHYQSASQLSTIEWQRCMLACSYSTTSVRIPPFYIT